jgi:hypothetical protein
LVGVFSLLISSTLGVSQRGDVIAIALPGANFVDGGLMGQGKSNACPCREP